LRALFAWASNRATGRLGEKVNPGEIGLRTAAALGRFWEMHGHVTEGRERLTTALSYEQTHLLTTALSHGQTHVLTTALSYGQTHVLPIEGHDNNARHIAAQVSALNASAALAIVQGDYTSAQELLTESLRLSREHNYKQGVAAGMTQ